MLRSLLGYIEPNGEGKRARLRAPLCEQYAREVEEATFLDERTKQTFSYDDFSASVKKFGYGG